MAGVVRASCSCLPVTERPPALTLRERTAPLMSTVVAETPCDRAGRATP